MIRDAVPATCLHHLRKLFGSLALGLLYFAVAPGAFAQTWTLAWSDEFNGAANSPINSANWQYDTGILNINDEAEYYCAPGSSTSPCDPNNPNAYIDGQGHLVIQAIRINSSGAPYSGSWTSARLNSGNNLQSFSYGRLESSMALPTAPGLWPAFWALGNNFSSVGWPECGEIDFMENVPASGGLGPTAISSTIHGGSPSAGNYGLGLTYNFSTSDPNGPDVTTFHTYGAIWSTNMVQFYVDDPTNIFFVRTTSDVAAGLPWDFNHPFFLILNLAVGGTGSWPGPPDNTTPSPALMQVDYVRWYQPAAIAGPAMTASPISVTAGQIGTSTVNLTSTTGTGRVYLSCSTTAPQASCSISTSDPLDQYTVDFSQMGTGTATVRVTTTGSTSAGLPARRIGLPTWTWSGPALPLTGLAVTFLLALTLQDLTQLVLTRRVRPRRLGLSTFAPASLGIVLLLAGLPGCGGGSSGGAGGGGGGTAPGSYSVTVSAFTVSNSSGTADSTVSIPLTVN
jgi:beta-glucanase (GH16 family)